MYDPFQLGLMSMTAQSQPGLFARAMSSMGFKPPGGTGVSPYGMDPTLGGQLPGGMGPPTPEQAAMLAAQGSGGINPMAQALMGVKAMQPGQPLMHGGIAGASKAPEPGQIQKGSAVGQAFQQSVAPAVGAPLRVPALGQLLGR